MKKMISTVMRLRFWRAAWCAAMVCVTVLALLPPDYLQLPVFSWWDKAQHALAFMGLTGLCLQAWPGRPWRVVLGMVVYGGLIELAQWATGWRLGEWADLAADVVGIGLAWAVSACWVKPRLAQVGQDSGPLG